MGVGGFRLSLSAAGARGEQAAISPVLPFLISRSCFFPRNEIIGFFFLFLFSFFLSHFVIKEKNAKCLSLFHGGKQRRIYRVAGRGGINGVIRAAAVV